MRRTWASWENPRVAFYDELADLLDEVANSVTKWTDHPAWTFEPGSAAAAEVANAEIRSDGSPWGDRPIRTAYSLAQMSTMFTVEMAHSGAVLIRAQRPPIGTEVLTRTSLEAASVVWWLLEDGLTARQRVCRMQLLRRNSARELARSIRQVKEDPSVAGNETIPAIEAECAALGLAPFGQGGDELDGQTRLGYTKRVEKLTDEIGYQGGYSIYSGTAHAELAGLWRLFQHVGALYPSRAPLHRPAANPLAAWAAAAGLLNSMLASMERVALLFGWTVPGKADELSATIEHVNSEIARLRP
jgi:hypothetical protein